MGSYYPASLKPEIRPKGSIHMTNCPSELPGARKFTFLAHIEPLRYTPPTRGIPQSLNGRWNPDSKRDVAAATANCHGETFRPGADAMLHDPLDTRSTER